MFHSFNLLTQTIWWVLSPQKWTKTIVERYLKSTNGVELELCLGLLIHESLFMGIVSDSLRPELTLLTTRFLYDFDLSWMVILYLNNKNGICCMIFTKYGHRSIWGLTSCEEPSRRMKWCYGIFTPWPWEGKTSPWLTDAFKMKSAGHRVRRTSRSSRSLRVFKFGNCPQQGFSL